MIRCRRCACGEVAVDGGELRPRAGAEGVVVHRTDRCAPVGRPPRPVPPDGASPPVRHWTEKPDDGDEGS